jgi:two-component system, NtrC family, response regulator
MILIVDDDPSVTASLALLLKQAGYASHSVAGPQAALMWLARERCELVIQDMNFSRRTTGEEGLDLLARIKDAAPALPVILITAWGSIGLAVEGMKKGAADFVTKPWTNQQILQTVQTALGLAASRPGGVDDGLPTREDLDARFDFGTLVGRDPRLLRILQLIGRVAPTDASVLITGESGTGKELVADAIHRNSRRAQGPFVKVNLGGISASLFESEMFGHVKGAFTDARADRKGRFEVAHGGTIFLDEIGDLHPASQVKMLRVLQDRTFEVLGSSQRRTVDVRVVAATNRNLAEMVTRGEFREDLRAPASPARAPRRHCTAREPVPPDGGAPLWPRGIAPERGRGRLAAGTALAREHPPAAAIGRTHAAGDGAQHPRGGGFSCHRRHGTTRGHA